MNAIGSAVVRFGAAAFVLAPTMLVGATVGIATAPAPPSTAEGGDLAAAVEAFVGDAQGGAVALVVRDGETTTAAAGVANAAGDAMTPDTVFRVGSISKPFVATLVMQLVDEGKVDLDAPLSTYLPNTPIGGNVTIRNLLRHRSGLPNYTDVEDLFWDALADRTRAFTPAELLEYIADVPPGVPDQAYQYSSTNYILLGQLVEQLEATELHTVLATRISQPLELVVTHLAVPGEPAIPDLAGGWYPGVVDGDPAGYDSIASMAWAAGAVISNAGELHTFFDALFGGELVSDAALAEMTDPGPDDYGLGLGILELPSGTRLYGHNGDIFGYLSITATDPDTGDTLVILSNNDELQPSVLAEQLLADW